MELDQGEKKAWLRDMQQNMSVPAVEGLKNPGWKENIFAQNATKIMGTTAQD